MESLSGTTWDVVIGGTGIRQSLLALALSRSGKKILHVDRNKYYGGTEAAFSLEDASKWLDDSQNNSHCASSIEAISLRRNFQPNKLGASRSYTLSLSPHLIYSKSSLLPALVASGLHTQIEFQAVGTWWIYKDDAAEASQIEDQNSQRTSSQGGQIGLISHITGTLQKIPSTREDVFADDTLSPRDKRSLMRFLRSIVIEAIPEAGPAQDAPFSPMLTSLQAMTPVLSEPLLALSLSHDSPGAVKTRSAVSRIRRHIQSIGMFGPGFGAVMPKYGGGAEIAQVACRASAVGGAVYVLGRGLDKISEPNVESAEAEASSEEVVRLQLSDGEEITARFVTGCAEDLPTDMPKGAHPNLDLVKTVHSISIISSPLEHLFPPTSESGPVPAGAVVVYGCHDRKPPSRHDSASESGPVYMLVHSSESGECPTGQCVIYSSTPSPPTGDEDQDLQRLDDAVARLLSASALPDSKPEVLWSLKYHAKGRPTDSEAGPVLSSISGRVMVFPPASIDLAFDDSILENVKELWKRIVGDGVEESDFLKFEDRRADEGDV